VPADKKKAVAIMDTVEYREKVGTLLSDEDTYTKITDKHGIQNHELKRTLTSFFQKLIHVLPLMARMSSKWI